MAKKKKAKKKHPSRAKKKVSKKRPSRAKKKVKSKSKPKKTNGNIEIVSTAGITFAKAPKRGSKYDGILEKMAKLKAGQSVVVSVPQGMSPQVFQNRLNSSFAKIGPKPPKGCSFHKRTTKDGKVAISCTKD